MNDGGSWDWPASVAAFRELEENLRCGICCERFNRPVMLPCSHNYCSVCIRRTFEFCKHCPTCKTAFLLHDLKPNRAVDLIGRCFFDTKPTLLPLVSGHGLSASAASGSSHGGRVGSSQSSMEADRKISAKENSQTPARKRMPNLNYHMYKDPKLRELLKEINLSTDGTKEHLIWKHKEYTLRYNAECDAEDPLPPAKIAAEVEKAARRRLEGELDIRTTRKQFGVNKGEWDTASNKEVIASNFRKLAEQAKIRMRMKKTGCDGASNLGNQEQKNEGELDASTQNAENHRTTTDLGERRSDGRVSGGRISSSATKTPEVGIAQEAEAPIQTGSSRLKEDATEVYSREPTTGVGTSSDAAVQDVVNVGSRKASRKRAQPGDSPRTVKQVARLHVQGNVSGDRMDEVVHVEQALPGTPELQKKRSIAKPENWSCSACTLINPMTRSTCEICATRAPEWVLSARLKGRSVQSLLN